MKRHLMLLGKFFAHPLRPLCTRALMFAALCAVAVPYQSMHQLNVRVEPNYVLPATKQSAAGELIARHHCWQGRSPWGITPTRAVVELDPRRGPVLRDAETGFAIWLEDAPGTLYAFCR